jgi:uncharacterized membrane protein YhiD involved in acid resistance
LELALPPEAWVALGVGLAGIASTIIWAVVVVTGAVSKAVTRFELVGEQQAVEIKEIKDAVQRMQEIVALVAVQKDQIQSIRETQQQNTARTDETFKRVFAILDGMRAG